MSNRFRAVPMPFGLCVTRVGILIVCGCLAFTFRHAESQAGDLFIPQRITLESLRFAPGAQYALLEKRLWLYGQETQILFFDTPQTITELIAALSVQQPALTDLQIVSGQTRLTAWLGSRSWVVQMHSLAPARTVGSVSVIHFRENTQVPVPAWLPADVHLHFDMALQEGGRVVREQIWRHALLPEANRALIERGLQRAGWHRVMTDGLLQCWKRKGNTLQWLSSTAIGGSAIWLRSVSE